MNSAADAYEMVEVPLGTLLHLKELLKWGIRNGSATATMLQAVGVVDSLLLTKALTTTKEEA